MKNFAIGILMVILLSIIVEPMVEIMEVGREKIILGTALSNSCRATVLSLKSERLRDLDAEVDQDVFHEKFSAIFEDAMNVTRISDYGNVMTFSSNDNTYNDITVRIDFEEDTDVLTEQTVSTIEVGAETKYKFKTKYLKAIADTRDDQLTSERLYIFSVKN